MRLFVYIALYLVYGQKHSAARGLPKVALRAILNAVYAIIFLERFCVNRSMRNSLDCYFHILIIIQWYKSIIMSRHYYIYFAKIV